MGMDQRVRDTLSTGSRGPRSIPCPRNCWTSGAGSAGPHVESGKLRLLVTYGSKRTKRWPNVPTLDELGYKTVSDSPFGVCGPKGMDPAVTQRIHDAFRKTLDDPAVLATFEKYDQSVIYLNTADYTKFARDNYASEKAVIERLGLAAKI